MTFQEKSLGSYIKDRDLHLPNFKGFLDHRIGMAVVGKEFWAMLSDREIRVDCILCLLYAVVAALKEQNQLQL